MVNGLSALPTQDLCSIQNGFCSDYCRTNGQTRECYCADGWQLDPNNNTQCIEINECDNPNACNSDQKCLNLQGTDLVADGYRCRCDWGFEPNEDNSKCVNSAAVRAELQRKQSYFQIITDDGRCMGHAISSFHLTRVTCGQEGWNTIWYHTEDGEIHSTTDRSCIGVWNSCEHHATGAYQVGMHPCSGGEERDQVFEFQEHNGGYLMKMIGCDGIENCPGFQGDNIYNFGCGHTSTYTIQEVDMSNSLRTPVDAETLSTVNSG